MRYHLIWSKRHRQNERMSKSHAFNMLLHYSIQYASSSQPRWMRILRLDWDWDWDSEWEVKTEPKRRKEKCLLWNGKIISVLLCFKYALKNFLNIFMTRWNNNNNNKKNNTMNYYMHVIIIITVLKSIFLHLSLCLSLLCSRLESIKNEFSFKWYARNWMKSNDWILSLFDRIAKGGGGITARTE